MSVVGISGKNDEQKQLIRSILDKSKPIVLCTGFAGTGKSLITIASALELCKTNQYGQIIYSRDAVQLGEQLGFLKGTLAEKFDPYMACLYDSLDVIQEEGTMKTDAALEYISCEPITFMRGRSFSRRIVIIDEAQNLDMNTIKTLLTRLRENSKIILLGDKVQIDKKGQSRLCCDFETAIDKLKDEDFVDVVHLVKSERSSFCTRIDELL